MSTSTDSPVASRPTQNVRQPDWLLDGFARGDIFFASQSLQHRSRAAAGCIVGYEPATRGAVEALFAKARQQGVEDPVMFGLVPFDSARAASLTIPLQYAGAESCHDASASPADVEADRPAIVAREPVPAPEAYGDMVRKALGLFAEGGVKKIVLSRTLDVTLDRPVAYEPMLRDLLRRNRHGYTFSLPIWDTPAAQGEPAGVMLGASPELLVRREGDRVFLNPLAGSIGRHQDPETDQARKEGLARSEKDLREHAYVIDDIVRILREHCDELDVPDGPSVIGTDALWHLSTFITGRLRDPEMTALDLSCALHPTPAICGYPTAAAFRHIDELEPFDRGYFTGLVGWQRENGDGEWALTLRCAMQTGENQLRLYAGAGTVAGSDPGSEITETATKMETFLRAIS